MNQFHGYSKKSSYFEGFYLKHQTETHTLALIPAYHINEEGKKYASLQIIDREQSYWLEYPWEQFGVDTAKSCVTVGNCVFSNRGIVVQVDTPQLTLSGVLRYGTMTPLPWDIMGPFHYLPFMQCNHGIISLHHSLTGTLRLNGQTLDFTGGSGYIEKDWGSSFPKQYLWTQCSWSEKEPACVSLSVAHIPIAAHSFTGCICVVYYRGVQYRLATYYGAKVTIMDKGKVCITQGRYTLEVSLLTRDNPATLHAPQRGEMSRRIEESLAATVHYKFSIGQHVLLDVCSQEASFEWVC